MSDAHHHRGLWQRAVSFAARCHQGQLRKDEKTPYIAHPMRVALTVRMVFGVEDATALATALLHDVIEDTTADYDDVIREFGREVADAVACLSKDKRMAESAREPAFYQRIAAGPWQAKLVKLADVYDNICDAAHADMRRKAIAKAQLAIDAAGDDERLRPAIDALRRLIDDV